jgi:hypothetical protein
VARAWVLAIVLVLAVSCGGGSGDEGTPPESTATPSEEGVALEGETIAGERVALADYRGTPVFVNVWASW